MLELSISKLLTFLVIFAIGILELLALVVVSAPPVLVVLASVVLVESTAVVRTTIVRVLTPSLLVLHLMK